MLCKNCGAPLSEESAFCTQCGAKNSETTTPETENTSPVEVNEATTPELEMPVENDTSSVANVAKTFAGKLPKKTLLIPIVAVAAVVVFSGIVALAAFTGLGDYAKNAAVKMVKSPEDYLAYVVNDNADELAGNIATSFALSKENLAEGIGASGSIAIEIEDKCYDMLDEFVDNDELEYISWLKQLSLAYEANNKDSVTQATLSMKLNDVEIGKFDVITDLESERAYFGIGEYNPDYLMTELDFGYNDPTELTEALSKLASALPDEKTTHKLLTKYVKVAVENIEDVKESSAKMTAGNISQKLTKLSVDLDGNLVKNVSINFLNAMKDDQECKDIVENIASAYDVDADDFWDELDEAIEDIEDADTDDIDLDAKLHFYVNGKGEIVGLEIKGDGFSISSITTEKGSKFGSLIEIKADGNKFKIEGNGKISGNKRTGTFTVKATGMSILEFDIKNVNTKQLEEGIFNGSITLRLHEDMVDMIESQSYGDVSFSALTDLSITIDSKNKSRNDMNCTLSVNYKDEHCGRLILTSKQGKSEAIDIPSNYVDANDNDELLSWVEDFDTSKLADNLEKANAPSEVVDAVEETQEDIIDSLNWSYYDYYDDYDDDDYSYYGY